MPSLLMSNRIKQYIFPLLFPHIIRKITARHFKLRFRFITFILICLSIYNIIPEIFASPSIEQLLREEAMQYPSDVNIHLKLGQYYLDHNLNQARKEYLLAQELFIPQTDSQSRVLGIETTSPQMVWNQIENRNQTIEKEIGQWEKIYILYPDYLYTYYKLSSLFIQLGNTKMAKQYIQIALEKSPSDRIALQIAHQLK